MASDPIEDDLLEGAIEQERPHHAPLARRKLEFQPWHRPRKQYVRRFQWRDAVESLLGVVKQRKGRTLSYLSLPGADLLDVRDLRALCVDNECNLKFLGFKTVAKDAAHRDEELQLTISLNELRSLPGVDTTSNVFHDALQNLADRRTVAYSHAGDFGPFDVVNFDLCDSIASRGDGGQPRYYDAINQLLAIQRYHKDSWVLLLTTRTNHDAVHPSDLLAFGREIRSNSAQSSKFASKIKRLYGAEIAGVLCEDKNETAAVFHSLLSQHPALQFMRVFGLGFCKWLLGRIGANSPGCGMRLRSGMYYAVHQEPDMLSVAIEVQPNRNPVPDDAGLAAYSSDNDAVVDEVTLALDLIERINMIEDVDSLLKDNLQIKEQIIAEAAALLAQAGYEGAEYAKWVAQGNL